MSAIPDRIPPGTPDGLRLVALGRIPRCADCARFAALAAAHAGRRPAAHLPPVPDACRHAVCAPLAARWSRSVRRAPPLAAVARVRHA